MVCAGHTAWLLVLAEASQERIRAAQERLSALGLDSHLGLPEAHPAGYHCLEGYREHVFLKKGEPILGL